MFNVDTTVKNNRTSLFRQLISRHFWKQVTLVILTLLYLTPFYFCKQSDRLTEVKTIKSALWDLRKGERVRFYGGQVYNQ